jgi:hypothetical protein
LSIEVGVAAFIHLRSWS